MAIVNWRDPEHSLAGGSEIYAWEFARALHEGGAEVEFLTAREPGQEATTVRDGIVVRRRGGPLSFYPHTALRLLARRRRVDAVIDPSCGLPSFAPLFLRRRTPVLLVMHHVHQRPVHDALPRARRGVRPVARAGPDAAGLPPAPRRRGLARRPSRRCAVSSAGPGRSACSPTARTCRPVGAGSPASKDPDRVAVLGRLVAHKRVDLVIRAVDALRTEHPRLQLDVIGKGPERRQLEGLAARLGLAHRVTFHGFVDDEHQGGAARPCRRCTSARPTPRDGGRR